jgi:hypothetical protein
MKEGKCRVCDGQLYVPLGDKECEPCPVCNESACDGYNEPEGFYEAKK